MEFEFLRPQLLFLLLPWCLLVAIMVFTKKVNNKGSLIAPHLAHAIMVNNDKNKQSQPWLLSVFALLTIICLAGPSFEKQEVPVFKTKQARVVVMDMSYSMFSTDVKPNRLTQARFKALDMIELFKEGETALVAYAGDAFTVSPLTSDASTLSNLIPSLSPDIMPSKGSNVYAGVDQAVNLLSQAGYLQGEIILVTDGLEQEDIEDLRSTIQGSQHTLSIYAVGTAQGAPIALPEGGFLKDNSGQIVIPKLFATGLKQLALNSGGSFAQYSANAQDINVFAPNDIGELDETEDEKSAVLWRIDAGVYGLALLIPLALWLLRQSALLLCALLFVLPLSKPVYASTWQSWFKNTDQNALSAYQDKQFAQADKATDATLKGAALYKQGKYQEAANALKGTTSMHGQYNLGNALAHTGDLDGAIAAYDKALALNPDFKEAQENKALVEQLKQQQEQQKQEQESQDQQQQSDEQKDSGDNSDQQNGQKSDQQSDQGEEQTSQDKQSEGSEQESQSEPQMQSEQKEDDSQSDQEPQPQQAEQSQDEEQKEQAQQEQMMGQPEAKPLTPEELEKAQQLNQLLRKVPDNPAILLRNKMQLEAQQRAQQRRRRGVEKSW